MSVQVSVPVSATASRILIADDQPDVIEALRLLLKPEGYLTRHRRLAGRRITRRSTAASTTSC